MTASIRRVLSLSTLGMALLATPMLSTPAHACGPYGAPSAFDIAVDTAMLAQTRLDPARTVMAWRPAPQDDDGQGFAILLVLEDEDGDRFDRTFEIDRDDDGVWSVMSVGPLRPHRATA